MWICRPGLVYALCMTMPNHFFFLILSAACVWHNGWNRVKRAAWPAPSPDLNPIDFYLGGHLWSTVYSAEFCDMWDLKQ